MKDDLKRVEFDATLEDLVDTQARAIRQTKTGRSWRHRAVVASGLAAGVAFFAVVLLMLSVAVGKTLASSVAVSGVGGLVLGVLWGFLYGHVYDCRVRRRSRRFVAEWLGGIGPFHCEIELRSNGVWVRQNSIEILCPWSDATGVEDTGDVMELRFRGGLVVVRNRVFRTASDRNEYLEHVRGLMAQTLSP
jgi:hypothetical protein